VTPDPREGPLSRVLHGLQRAARTVLFHDLRVPLRLGLGLICRARLIGEERVPLSGGLIVAANHTSFADPVVLQTFVPRRLTYLMTDKYYFVPVLHPLLRLWGVLVVKEQGLNKEVIRAAAGVLERGGAVGIFPEGAISRDGLVHDAQPGAALLARRAGVPILPVGLAGIGRLMPPDTWRLHRSRLTIYVGDPISPVGLSRRELAERLTRDLRAVAQKAREENAGRGAAPFL